MLGFETIVKGIIAITVLFVVIIIATNLFPEAMKDFFNATNLDSVLKVGKETHESDFKVPENMQENAELIKEKIEEMSAEDYKPKTDIIELSIGTIDIDLTDDEKKKIDKTELEKFDGTNLAIIKDDTNEGKSDITYISVAKQIKYLDLIKYSPCFVKAKEEGGCNPKVEFSDKQSVDKILFVDATHFKTNLGEKEYKLKGLAKVDGDVCFVW